MVSKCVSTGEELKWWEFRRVRQIIGIIITWRLGVSTRCSSRPWHFPGHFGVKTVIVFWGVRRCYTALNHLPNYWEESCLLLFTKYLIIWLIILGNREPKVWYVGGGASKATGSAFVGVLSIGGVSRCPPSLGLQGSGECGQDVTSTKRDLKPSWF